MSKSLFAFCRHSLNFRRRISLSSIYFSKQTIQKTHERRTERYMKRTVDLLNESKRPKQKRWNFPQVSILESDQFSSNAKPQTQNFRRSQQLSVVFHDYISSLIFSGEVCPELLDLAFQIEKVKVVPDFSTVNVYWMTSDSGNEAVIETILPKCSAELRHTLTGLRIMGHVPPIRFCKDLTTMQLQKVEELLKIADMGPDVVDSEELDEDDSEGCLQVKSVNQETLNQEFLQLSKSFQSDTLYRSQDNDGKIVAKEYRRVSENKSEDQIVKIEDETECYGDDTECLEGHSTSRECSQMNMRSDLYDVPHSTLMQQVLHAKRKLHEKSSKGRRGENV